MTHVSIVIYAVDTAEQQREWSKWEDFGCSAVIFQTIPTSDIGTWHRNAI